MNGNLKIDRGLLADILVDQEELFRRRGRLIPREIQPQLLKRANSPSVVLITGLRRCGKSTLLGMVADELGGGHRFTFEDERLAPFKAEDFQSLLELMVERNGRHDHFFFDEIQEVPGWERFVGRLRLQGAKVWITGSNASLTGQEAGDRLTGRHVRLELFPFSFREYLAFVGETASPQGTQGKARIRRRFLEWLKDGGLPEYLATKDPLYLTSLYESILYRDVMARHRLTDSRRLRDFAWYLAGHVGKEISFNRIRNLLGFGSVTTVSNHFDHLEQAYLVFGLRRYSDSPAEQLRAERKSYFIDNALALRNGFRPTEDRGRLLENAVFLEFRRHGADIFYHRGKRECDFLLRHDGNIRAAFQVCESLADPTVQEREYEGLLEACRRFRLSHGTVLTLDEEGQDSFQNLRIRILPVWRWLLDSPRPHRA